MHYDMSAENFARLVMDFPWMDVYSVIRGSVRAWRAAFPAARAVNVCGVWRYIVVTDLIHIRGDARARLHTVNMTRCALESDAAFVHLCGIQKLGVN